MASTQPFLCPVCQTTFTAHQVGSVTLGLCDQCGGVWMTTVQLNAMAKQGAAVLDQLMSLESAHESHPHGDLACPGCHIPLHRTRYTGASNVWSSTCYNCGGLYIDEESLKNLDAQAHQVFAGAPPVSPEVAAITSRLDQMVQADRWRAQLMYQVLNAQCYGLGWGTRYTPLSWL